GEFARGLCAGGVREARSVCAASATGGTGDAACSLGHVTRDAVFGLEACSLVEQAVRLGDEWLCLLLGDWLVVELCAFEQLDHLGCERVALVSERDQFVFEVGVGAVVSGVAAFECFR